MSRSTGRSSGCFGCLWTGALLLGTLVPAAILWWIHPLWIERLMFWKPPLVEPPVAVMSSGPAPGGGQVDLTPREHLRLWDENAVRATARAGQATSLTTIEGSTIVLPPGAVPDGAVVRSVPVVELPRSMERSKDLFALGPVHDLRIDGKEHWRFARPIRLSLAFDPEVLPEDLRGQRYVLATWQHGAWQPLASSWDPVRKRVSASTDHACVVGVVTILTTTAVGSLVKFTETGQGLMRLLLQRPQKTYQAKNFAIHYNVSGPGAVIADVDYPLRSGRKAGGDPPLFVRDMGNFLEEARAALPDVRVHVAKAGMWRWDVFLAPLPVEGMSAMGGPVLLDNDFRWGKELAPHYGYLLRKTCTHELIHVAQDDYFNAFNAGGLRWWLESTAEYLAVRLLEAHGHPDPDPYRYLKNYPELLAVPFQQADTMRAYAYARYLAWMHDQGVDVVSLIDRVNAGGSPGAETIDSVLRDAGVHRGLRGTTLDFAKELYHRSLWQPKVVSAHLLDTWRAQPSTRLLAKGKVSPRDRFRILSWATRGSKAVRVHAFAELGFALAPLAVRAFDLQARALPAERQARLVVQILPTATHTRALLGTMNASAHVPLSGKPSPLVPVFGTAISARVASPAKEAGDINAATLLVANTSLRESVPRLTLRRWLLMGPQWVGQTRAKDGRVLVVWAESMLKKEAGDRAFAGYRVYRKPRGAAAFPEKPVHAGLLRDESFQENPPPGDWIYGVTVVDVVGNESEQVASFAEEEPFEGEWHGKVSLIRGTVSQPISHLVMGELEASGAAQDRNVQRLLGPFKLALRNADFILRLGIPMTVRVERTGRLYAVTPVKAFGRPLENPTSIMMQRIGPYTLAVVGEGGKVLTSRSLTLRRNGMLNQIYRTRYDDPDIGSGEIGLRVSFERTAVPSH